MHGFQHTFSTVSTQAHCIYLVSSEETIFQTHQHNTHTAHTQPQTRPRAETSMATWLSCSTWRLYPSIHRSKPARHIQIHEVIKADKPPTDHQDMTFRVKKAEVWSTSSLLCGGVGSRISLPARHGISIVAIYQRLDHTPSVRDSIRTHQATVLQSERVEEWTARYPASSGHA